MHDEHTIHSRLLDDPYLKPYAAAIERRTANAAAAAARLAAVKIATVRRSRCFQNCFMAATYFH